MAQRPNVVPIDLLRHSFSATGNLRAEAPLLLRGIIQFRKAIGDFHSGNVDLEALGDGRILRLLLGQGRNVRWEIVDYRWLNQVAFRHGVEDIGNSRAELVPSLLRSFTDSRKSRLQNTHSLFCRFVAEFSQLLPMAFDLLHR